MPPTIRDLQCHNPHTSIQMADLRVLQYSTMSLKDGGTKVDPQMRKIWRRELLTVVVTRTVREAGLLVTTQISEKQSEAQAGQPT